MRKKVTDKTLIGIEEFAKTYYSKRGFPVTPSYIWRLIRDDKAGKRKGKEPIRFKYKEIGKSVWIVKESTRKKQTA